MATAADKTKDHDHGDWVTFDDGEIPSTSESQKEAESSGGMNKTLFDSLDVAADTLSKVKNVSSVVSFVGETGDGKTSLSLMLTQDLSKMTAEDTDNTGQTTITDDWGKIGPPSCESKTIMPEFYTSRGHPSTVLDATGWRDTRGDLQDIVSNFVLIEILKKVSSVKMLFTVNYSSTLRGERNSFDSIVGNAVRFLKNLDKFSESIGLVITKVPQYLTAENMENGVRKCLQNYLEEQENKIDLMNPSRNKLSNNEIETILRKIKFTRIILNNEGKGDWKIVFSRTPEILGTLDKSNHVREDKTKIWHFIETVLVDSGLNPSTDIEMSVREDTLNRLSVYIEEANREIVNLVSKMTKDFLNFYHNLVVTSFKNIKNTKKKVKRDYMTVDNQVTRMLSDETMSVEKFMLAFQALLISLSYPIPEDAIEFPIERLEEYFSMFHKIMAGCGNQYLTIEDRPKWGVSLEEMKATFKRLSDWYEFLFNVDRLLKSYHYQSKREKDTANWPKKGESIKWLQYLKKQFEHSVEDHVKLTANAILEEYPQHIDFLANIMRLALEPPTIDFKDGHLVVDGCLVKLSDFINENGDFFAKYAGVTYLRVYAIETIFLDRNINGKGMNLIIFLIAPEWNMVSNVTINLNGRDAARILFSNGKDEPRTNKDGDCGLPGGPGGTIYGFCNRGVGDGRLKIQANGGKGGRGQDGLEGDWKKISLRGGNGGKGGEGGNPGCVQINVDDGDHTFIESEMEPGAEGEKGKGRVSAPKEVYIGRGAVGGGVAGGAVVGGCVLGGVALAAGPLTVIVAGVGLVGMGIGWLVSQYGDGSDGTSKQNHQNPANPTVVKEDEQVKRYWDYFKSLPESTRKAATSKTKEFAFKVVNKVKTKSQRSNTDEQEKLFLVDDENDDDDECVIHV